jgi:ankyrin repeat protein
MAEYDYVKQPVVRAVCENDAARLRELAASGAAVDEPDKMLGPPLLVAVQQQDRHLVALLLELGAKPDGPPLPRWETPLSAAALNRDVAAVKLLLGKGADPNLMRSDATPLFSAVSAGDTKIAALLLAAGGDVFRTNRYGVSPASCVIDDPPSAAMAKLIRAAAEKSAAQADLANAARFGATERVREIAPEATPAQRLEAAGLAVEHDHGEALRVLLEAGVKPDAVVKEVTRGQLELPLLHLAVDLGSDAALEVLLAAGADPNRSATVFEQPDTTPLMLAAQGASLARVKALVAASADAQIRNRQGETPLALARKAGRKAIVKFLEGLAAKPSTAPAAANLHEAVRDGQVEVVRALLAGGADANALDRNKRTPLMEAIDHDDAPMLALLLEHGADPCIAWPPHGLPTWEMALRQRSAAEMARLLLEAVDDPRRLARRKGSQGDPVAELWAGVFGVQKGAGVIAKLLLERGIDPNQRGPDGYTPLMWGAVFAHAKTVDAVQVLLEAGADPRAVKEADPAAVESRRRLVEAMAKQGVDYTPRPDPDAEPQTVLDLARRHNKKVYQVIRDHVGDDLEPYDAADAALKGLKSAAAESWFVHIAGEVGAQLRSKPQPWQRRAGVFHFSARLSRLPVPEGAAGPIEEMGDVVRLEPMQEWVRQRNAMLVYIETPNDARNITRLLLAPTTNWIAMLRMCGSNGVNYGLSTRDIVNWLLETGKQHPFELQGCGNDFVAVRFTQPIADYQALHASMRRFCPDLSDGEPEKAAELAAFYADDRRCFFWWD